MDGSVLVVDDEPDFAVTYERLLRREGCDAVSVGSRRAALEAFRSRPWRLVIVDLRLPDGDGLDVVRAARALPVPPAILVATVLGSRATRQTALDAGASAFLSKPFATEAFTRMIRELLGRP